MPDTVRLTTSQALVRYLCQQKILIDDHKVALFAGVWAIFGHGNVAGLGEALWHAQEGLPTFRGHNEQAMAHAAIAFAKANVRQRMMAVTTSIGPGATNLATAAALAHVNRLPVLFLPGDVFASRRPDPVLQQVEDFSDATVSANDCLRPVSRYFDRITRPEQIMPALGRALTVLTDPADCGPVTLALCQDVQAEAFDFPKDFFIERLWRPRRLRPDLLELAQVAKMLKAASRPMIIAGGGVLYANASAVLDEFARKHGIPVCETQGGKSALADDHPHNMGAIGVTGTTAANRVAEEADVVLAVGSRLQDFTTGSWALFKTPGLSIIGLNVQPFDATKRHATALVADARVGLSELSLALGDWHAPTTWMERAKTGRKQWNAQAATVTAPPAATENRLPTDAHVIGAVQKIFGTNATLVHAAGGLPGELHKLWRADTPGSYHAEYGYSTMGYEIAGGLGVKMATPERDVVIMLGDGSYLMMNSEIHTSIMLGLKIIIVVLDNRGYGCINRLQKSTGGDSFNNILSTKNDKDIPKIDFSLHAKSLGAISEKVRSIAELEAALLRARSHERTCVLVIDSDAEASTSIGGHWWDVAVPEVSERAEVRAARKTYEEKLGQKP